MALLPSTLLTELLLVQTQREVTGYGDAVGPAQAGPTGEPAVPSDGDNPMESSTLTPKQRRDAPFPPFSVLFFFLMAVPASYGGSQTRGRMRAAADSLHHSPSNARSEPCLRPTLQLTAVRILNPGGGQ